MKQLNIYFENCEYPEYAAINTEDVTIIKGTKFNFNTNPNETIIRIEDLGYAYHIKTNSLYFQVDIIEARALFAALLITLNPTIEIQEQNQT